MIGAVVVIGGFAAADAIRGNPRPERTSAPTIPVQTAPSRLPGPQPQPEAPPGWPEGLLDGALTFTDAKTCDIRVIGLAGGRERPVAHFGSDCFLWAPPVGSRVAYGLGASSQDGLHPFRIADLALPNQELGGYRALFGVVIWSDDAQRVAWCGRSRIGFDLEIGGPATRLPRCPVAYTRGRRDRVCGRQQGPRRRPARLHGGRRHHVREVRVRRLARGRRRRREARALGRKLPHDDEDPTRLPGHHPNPSCRQLCRALAHPPGRPAHRPRLQAGTDQPLVRGDHRRLVPGRDLGRDLERRRDRVPPCCRRRIGHHLAGCSRAMVWRPNP